MNSYTYLVVIKDFEPNNDWTFLANLYGPIIGQEAIGLYLTLINEAQVLKQLNYPKFDQSRLHRITGMDEDFFLATLKKLGSLKLVKIKIDRKTNFKKFEIFNPLEPSEFFANNLFERILAKKIGQENFEALKFIYKEKVDLENDKDYEDVTANFEDIFSSELDEISQNTVDDSAFIRLQSSKKTLLEKMLNLKKFNELLKIEDIKINYNLNKTKKIFNWALSLYNFDEVSFSQLIIANYDHQRKYLDFKKFETAVRDYAWQQKSSVQPSRLLKPLLTYDSQTNEAKIWEQIKIYETLEVRDFLRELTGKSRNDRTYNFSEDLKLKFQLSTGVVNLCLAYCYLINQRIVQNYLLKLMETLNHNQFTTTEQAFVYFAQLLNKRKQKSELREKTVTAFDFPNSLHSHFDNDNLQSKL